MINRQIAQDFLGRIFRVPEVCVSYRLLQTILFLTDSVFPVLFAYFDASMASIKWLMTHKYRGSIVVLSISESVEPNEEQKEMISGFQ